MPRPSLRYLLYSHDTYGLGHFRRAALIAGGIVAASPDAQVLIATGSPRAQAFALPERVDSLKLPSATKSSDGQYRPRKITANLPELVRLRAGLLATACAHFEPDVILVDQSPMGMAGELIPTLRQAADRQSRPRLVLGLRDIVDEAAHVRSTWDAHGAWRWIDRYDDVFVYGDERVLTTAQELDLDRRLQATVTHVGFVAPTMPDPIPIAVNDPFLLVTTGGGGDGHMLLRRFLDAAEAGATAGVHTKIVTGPLMSADRQAEVTLRADRISGIEVIEFADDLRRLISSAVGVVSMAGYNTVVEELAAQTPALLVPRTTPRLEQDIRASRLDPITDLERCPAEQLTTSRLRDFIDRVRTNPRIAHRPPDLRGVERVAALLTSPAATTAELTNV